MFVQNLDSFTNNKIVNLSRPSAKPRPTSQKSPCPCKCHKREGMSLPTSDFEFFTFASPLLLAETGITPEPIIQTASTWTHVGAPLSTTSLPPSYHTWSQGTFSSGDILYLFIPFLNFLHDFLERTHMTHYCLTIRAQKANSDFDIPRWHVDRRFFDSHQLSEQRSGGELGNEKRGESEKGGIKRPSCWKLATALLGPGTLFLKDGERGRQMQRDVEKRLKLEQRKKGHYAVGEDHVCTSFRCLGCADMAQSLRYELAEELRKSSPEIVSVGRGEVAVFRVDGYNTCEGEPAMHSEPVMSGGDRIFVHVVPGREEELRHLVEGWGMEFPRDWSQGVLQDLES